MAPLLMQFIQRLFRGRWKSQLENRKTFKRIHRNECVLTSISSRENLSVISSSTGPTQARSFDSINFEFKDDLCCLRKCCDKCFCEEGEAMAKSMRKKKQQTRWGNNRFVTPLSSARSESLISESEVECDTVSESSCDYLECCYREHCKDSIPNPKPAVLTLPVNEFVSFHAQAVLETAAADYETVPPSYENIPVGPLNTTSDPPYDVVPTREPRAVDQTSSNYENVLSIDCVDACVFKHISTIIDSTNNTLQVMFIVPH